MFGFWKKLTNVNLQFRFQSINRVNNSLQFLLYWMCKVDVIEIEIYDLCNRNITRWLNIFKINDSSQNSYKNYSTFKKQP